MAVPTIRYTVCNKFYGKTPFVTELPCAISFATTLLYFAVTSETIIQYQNVLIEKNIL